MNKFFWFALSILTFNVVYPQDIAYLKEKISNPKQVLGNATLKWITTNYDFDQISLSEAEVDERIGKIIASQSGKKVMDIQTPINSEKLKYHGFRQSFREMNVISNESLFDSFKKEYRNADSSKHVFQYGNLFILTTADTYRDQLHVYSMIRAFLIIQYKFPGIYKQLFDETEKLPDIAKLLDKPMSAEFTVFLNQNKFYIISIHSDTSANSRLPATTTNYGNSGYKTDGVNINDGNYLVSDNNHLIFLHKSAIENGGTPLEKEKIYEDKENVMREIRYLFDGVVQSLVHERMHNYIANYFAINSFCDYIRNNDEFVKDGSELNGLDLTYKYCEEPIVTNTANQLFVENPGLSKEVMLYYKNLFENEQVPDMKKIQFENLRGRIKELNRKNIKKDDLHEIFRIYF